MNKSIELLAKQEKLQNEVNLIFDGAWLVNLRVTSPQTSVCSFERRVGKALIVIYFSINNEALIVYQTRSTLHVEGSGIFELEKRSLRVSEILNRKEIVLKAFDLVSEFNKEITRNYEELRKPKKKPSPRILNVRYLIPNYKFLRSLIEWNLAITAKISKDAVTGNYHYYETTSGFDDCLEEDFKKVHKLACSGTEIDIIFDEEYYKKYNPRENEK